MRHEKVFGHIQVEALITTYKSKYRPSSIHLTLTRPLENREPSDDSESIISLSLERLTDIFCWARSVAD